MLVSGHINQIKFHGEVSHTCICRAWGVTCDHEATYVECWLDELAFEGGPCFLAAIHGCSPFPRTIPCGSGTSRQAGPFHGCMSYDGQHLC